MVRMTAVSFACFVDLDVTENLSHWKYLMGKHVLWEHTKSQKKVVGDEVLGVEFLWIHIIIAVVGICIYHNISKNNMVHLNSHTRLSLLGALSLPLVQVITFSLHFLPLFQSKHFSSLCFKVRKFITCS